MKITPRILVLAALVIGASTLVARADWFHDETPPPNAKPLSVAIKAVEDHGYKIITEVEFKDGKWEIEAHQAGGKEVELHVDPLSLQVSTE